MGINAGQVTVDGMTMDPGGGGGIIRTGQTKAASLDPLLRWEVNCRTGCCQAMAPSHCVLHGEQSWHRLGEYAVSRVSRDYKVTVYFINETANSVDAGGGGRVVSARTVCIA